MLGAQTPSGAARMANGQHQPSLEHPLLPADDETHFIRTVVEQGFSAVLVADAELPDPRVVYVNRTFALNTGLEADHVVGQRLSSLPGLASVQQLIISGIPAGGQYRQTTVAYQTRQGERWGEWRVGPVYSNDGSPRHWLVIFRDITEQRRLEKELLEISDRERQRLGQDLHDGLCQQLAAIELMSQVLEQRLSRRTRDGAERASEIARQVRDAINQTRLLARGLAPVTLESEGLASALHELAVNTEKLFRIECTFSADQPAPRLGGAVSLHAYRIAQEAVSNALKHGKARHVKLSLHSFGSDCEMSVVDDGRGLPDPVPNTGMGLRIMRYRADLLGGSLQLVSAPGEGTSLTLRFPALSPKPATLAFP
jgi:PAS domain S-box-containing protein